MTTVKRIAKRIEHEIGLSGATSVRIVRKLNKLAKTVDWATPVTVDGRLLKLARRANIGQKSGARVLVARKGHGRATKKK